MSMVATDLKGLFKINIKHRHDSYTDQYSRMFMVKLLLACTIVMGISWYTDKVNCIMPESQTNSEDFEKFVAATCWINGMYIYKELRMRHDEIGYYGIPKDLDSDGLVVGPTGKKHLCRTKPRSTTFIPYPGNAKCIPMKKTFFLQYQWMPFLIAAFALTYYIPYMIHVTANNDLINLREEILKDEPEVEKIVKFYFKESKNNKKRRMFVTVRQIMNLFVKIGYICVNFAVFYGLNSVLEGEFLKYGKQWINWSRLKNSVQYDYMGNQTHPRPGNELLPPFGYCEVYSSSKDLKQTFADHHKMVCEISQHVLYQYALILVWVAVVVGIVVSILGFIILLFNYIIGLIGIKRLGNEGAGKRLVDTLTYREIEYLEYMRKKNIPVYGEVLEKLRERMLETPTSMEDSYDKSDLPSYPMLPKKDKQDRYA